MPNSTFKRWTAAEIVKLAQKQSRVDIAAELGRAPGATAIKAHQLGVSLKISSATANTVGPGLRTGRHRASATRS
jgi:hypothetical protein